MIFNADITVYFHRYNKSTKADEWHKVQISNVSWYGGQKVTVGENGLNAADTYAVRIPAAVLPIGYVTPEEYNNAEDVTGLWTVQNGDVVAYGLLDIDITQAKEITGPCRSFVVTSVMDNRRGVPTVQHLRIEGK